MWNRTKGAVSQTLAKLEKRGFIERRKENGNAKNVYIYVTETGRRLSEAHRMYDLKQLAWMDNELHKDFTHQEIEDFYRVMHRYTELIKLISSDPQT